MQGDSIWTYVIPASLMIGMILFPVLKLIAKKNVKKKD